MRRIAAAVVAKQQHLGVIIDDDGERCAFITDRGELVSVAALARLLVSLELREHRTTRIAIDEQLVPDLNEWLTSIGSAGQVEPTAAAQLPSTVIREQTHLGLTADHRVWFGGDYPACDAILTLARVLQALSLTDAPMSEVIR